MGPPHLLFFRGDGCPHSLKLSHLGQGPACTSYSLCNAFPVSVCQSNATHFLAKTSPFREAPSLGQASQHPTSTTEHPPCLPLAAALPPGPGSVVPMEGAQRTCVEQTWHEENGRMTSQSIS